MNYLRYDDIKKEIIITGIGIKRLVDRINETYVSTSGYRSLKGSNIMNLFNSMEYITWDQTEIKFFVFFAAELYDMFLELGQLYSDPTYLSIADELFSETWLKNYKTKSRVKNDLSKLSAFTIIPKDFQLDFIENYPVLKHIYDLDGYILSFEQGLGKTFTAIAIAECLNKEHIYIISNNALKENWANEIKKYYKKYTNETLWKSEVFVNNNQNFRITEKTRFFIINMEAINDLNKIINPNKNNMIIVDESQYFRNLHSQRTEALIDIKEKANCHDCLLLSGTPIKALPNEIAPSLRLIDPNFTAELAEIYYRSFSDRSSAASSLTKERFKRVIYRKVKRGNIDLPEKHISTLRLKVPHPERFGAAKVKKDILLEYHEEYMRRLKSGIFTQNKKMPGYREHPPAGYNFDSDRAEFEKLVRRYSQAHPEKTEQYLRRIFQESVDNEYELVNTQNINDKYFTFLNRVVVPFTRTPEEKFILTKKVDGILGWSIAAISAAASTIGKITAKYKNDCFSEIWKYNSDEIIKMIKSCNKKTVIFSSQLPIVEYISNDLTKKGIKNIAIHGGQSNRMAMINKFKSDPEIDVLVATTQTLAHGVTLTEASQMFFFGTPYRSTDFDQATDRIHRIGQTDPVNIYNVLLASSEKNITNRIEEILNWSEEMFNSIITEEYINDTRMIINEQRNKWG